MISRHRSAFSAENPVIITRDWRDVQPMPGVFSSIITGRTPIVNPRYFARPGATARLLPPLSCGGRKVDLANPMNAWRAAMYFARSWRRMRMAGAAAAGTGGAEAARCADQSASSQFVEGRARDVYLAAAETRDLHSQMVKRNVMQHYGVAENSCMSFTATSTAKISSRPA